MMVLLRPQTLGQWGSVIKLPRPKPPAGRNPRGRRRPVRMRENRALPLKSRQFQKAKGQIVPTIWEEQYYLAPRQAFHTYKKVQVGQKQWWDEREMRCCAGNVKSNSERGGSDQKARSAPLDAAGCTVRCRPHWRGTGSGWRCSQTRPVWTQAPPASARPGHEALPRWYTATFGPWPCEFLLPFWW